MDSRIAEELEELQRSRIGSVSSISVAFNNDSNWKREFYVRFSCMQSRFLRYSRLNKLAFLDLLLEQIHSLSTINIMCNVLYSSSGKLEYFSKFQGSTNFVYDKVLFDHNRSLEQKENDLVSTYDIEWFHYLPDIKQMTIFIGLLRLGGGDIIHRMYKNIVKRSFILTKEYSLHPENITEDIEIASYRIYRSEYNLLESDLPLNNYKPNIREEYNAEYDPESPFSIEVAAKKKHWDKIIATYRIQVEGRPKKAKTNKKKKGSKGKSSKSSKKSDKTKSKKSKAKKSSKSSKKSKKKGKKKGKLGPGDDILDWIQLLPVWIIKKIFSYLNKKTLKKVKEVNSYWAYVITDLQKEVKTRKKINKIVKKMEKKFEPSPLPEKPKSNNMFKYTQRQRRLQQLSKRGATLGDIKPKCSGNLCRNCALTDMLKERSLNYVLPMENLVPFPREKSDEMLYTTPACILQDLNLIYVKDVKKADGETYIAIPCTQNLPTAPASTKTTK